MATSTVARVERRRNHRGWDYTISWLTCGHSASETAVGAEVECERCDWQMAALAKVRAAVEAGEVSHSRASRFSQGAIDVYVHDKSSPTGVHHLATLDATPAAAALLRGGLSPLSPTESR